MRLDRYENGNLGEFQPIRVIWEESFRTVFASFGIEGDAGRAVKILNLAFNALNVEPHQVVHVGDARADISDRSKITSHNLSAKVLKTLDILQTECELIFEPALNRCCQCRG